jgi:hypothetical protein
MLKQREKYIFEHSLRATELEGPHPEASSQDAKKTHLRPIRGWHMDSRAHKQEETA